MLSSAIQHGEGAHVDVITSGNMLVSIHPISARIGWLTGTDEGASVL